MSNPARFSDKREQARRCMKCGACMAVCPTYRATGREALVARGRLSLVEAVLDGEQGLTRAFAERISKCIGCRACEAVCPSGLDIMRVLTAARADMAASGRYRAVTRIAARRAIGGSEGRPPRGLRLAAALEQAAYERSPGFGLLPYWRRGAKRSLPSLPSRTLSELLPEITSPANSAGGRVVFYPGCATNIFYPATGLALAGVLSDAGIEVVTPRGWRCCGLPFLSLGDITTARQLAEDNVRLLSAIEADAVVTVCSSCALSLREDIPALLGKERGDAQALAEKVVDIHQYLSREDLNLRLPHADPGTTRVTFHNPCHLRWGLGVEAGPGEIISRLPGVEYIEAQGAGDCCGGGGLFSLHHYDLALEIGGARIEDIAATGADVVATGCPSCRAQLTDLLRRAGSPARVVHTVELLAGGMLPPQPGT